MNTGNRGKFTPKIYAQFRVKLRNWEYLGVFARKYLTLGEKKYENSKKLKVTHIKNRKH